MFERDLGTLGWMRPVLQTAENDGGLRSQSVALGGYAAAPLGPVSPTSHLAPMNLVGAAVLCGTWASVTPTLPRLNLSHTPALPDTSAPSCPSGGGSRTQ
jgi:hypothetical protein